MRTSFSLFLEQLDVLRWLPGLFRSRKGASYQMDSDIGRAISDSAQVLTLFHHF
jgi:hypothetical protein